MSHFQRLTILNAREHIEKGDLKKGSLLRYRLIERQLDFWDRLPILRGEDPDPEEEWEWGIVSELLWHTNPPSFAEPLVVTEVADPTFLEPTIIYDFIVYTPNNNSKSTHIRYLDMTNYDIYLVKKYE